MTIKDTYQADILGEWNFRKGSIADQSGKNNDGTGSGPLLWGRSTKGRGLIFDGDSTKVDVGSDTVGTKDVTIIAGMNLTGFGEGGTSGRILDNGKFSFELGSDALPRIRLTSDGFGVVVSGATGDVELNKNHILGVTRQSDGTANFYVDGVLSGTADQGSGTPEAGSTNSIIGNNNATNGTLDGIMNFCIQFDRILTNLEMAQFYEEYTKEAHLDYIPEETNLSEGDIETSVTGAWDMNVRGGTLLDVTGGGNNGVISGTGSTQVDGVFGKALQFPGVDNNSGVQIQEDSLIDDIFVGGGAVEAWVLATSDGGTSLGRIADKGAWFLLCQSEAAGFVRLWFRKGFTGTNGDWKTTDVVMPLNTPVHVIVSYDDGAEANNPIFFINGTEYIMGSGMDETDAPVGTATSDASLDLWIGSTSSNNGIWGGWIDTVKLHNKTFTQAEAQVQYEKGKNKLVYNADGKDWNVSTANVTAGLLENTGWQVESGTWQIDSSIQKGASGQLITDGDMEDSTTDEWIVHNNAILTKSTDSPHSGSRALRVAYDGTPNPGAQKNLFDANKTYRYTGWARGDGTYFPYIFDGATIWSGTTSTSWQRFDVTSAPSSQTRFRVWGGAGAWVEFDDVKVIDVVPDGRKQLTCVGTGSINIPSEQAFGTWEFEVNPASGGVVTRVYFIASDATGYLATTEGYFFAIIGTAEVEIYKSSGGGAATKFKSNEIFTFGSWHKFKVTRNGKTFNVYYDNAGVWTLLTVQTGAMPFTDATPLTSNIILIENNTGNNVRNFKLSPVVQ